jgi:sec-independent protein translocase protein TatC
MADDLTMSFLQHLEELKGRVTICLIAFLIIFGAVYMLSIRTTEIGDVTVPYPYPDFYNNIPAQLFEQFKADLLPDNVILLNIGGIDALLVDVKIAMFLAFAISTPIFAWQAARFITPALRMKERRFIAKIVGPSTLLFVLGALFAYFFFTPIAMDFFFSYSEGLGVGIPIIEGPAGGTANVTGNGTWNWTLVQIMAPTMGVTNFLSWITMMTLAFGLIFELPVFMVALTKLGIVKAKKWLEGWRYAVVAFLIIGGIITPDVSGVTQILVALPMTGLYLTGAAFAFWIERRDERKAAE